MSTMPVSTTGSMTVLRCAYAKDSTRCASPETSKMAQSKAKRDGARHTGPLVAWDPMPTGPLALVAPTFTQALRAKK